MSGAARQIFGLAAVLSLCAIIVLSHSTRADRNLAAEIARSQAPYADHFSRDMGEFLRDVTQSGPFRNRWTLDGEFDPSRLNIYLVDSRLPASELWRRRNENLAENCTASTSGKLIVCDQALASRLAHTIELERVGPPSPHVEHLLLQWMLAHEIGHLLLGHRGVHFFAKPLEMHEAGNNVAEEQEADDFAASQISRASNRTEFEALLIELANAEVRRLAGPPTMYGAGILFDYDRPIALSIRCSHPAYVVRAYSMLVALANLQNDTGLLGMVSSMRHIFEPSDQECTE